VNPPTETKGPIGVMGPTGGSKLRALRLSLLFCLGLTGPALAQDNAEPPDPAIQAPDPGDYDKISELLDSIQTRVDETNANAKNTDAAMAVRSGRSGDPQALEPFGGVEVEITASLAG